MNKTVNRIRKGIRMYLVLILFVGFTVNMLVPKEVEANVTYEEPETLMPEITIEVPEVHQGSKLQSIDNQESLQSVFKVASNVLATPSDINPISGIVEDINNQPIPYDAKPELVVQEPELYLNLNANDMAIFARIVEAEVTAIPRGCTVDDALLGKFRVARVIINRILSDKFPNTMEGVVFQPRQFTPTSDGRYYKVNPNELTYQAIELALRKDIPDDINGAMYFTTGKFGWAGIEFVMRDSTGHRFYKYK